MKKNYKRLQFDFSEESLLRLEKLINETEASTKAEVVRNALKLFEFAVNKSKEGYNLKFEKDGKLIEVAPLLF